MTAALAAVAAAAAAVLAGHPRGRRAGHSPRPRPPHLPRGRLLSPGPVRVLALGSGLCLAAAGLGVVGVGLGAVAAVLLPRLLVGAADARAVAGARRSITADLPWALELLAAVVRSGGAPTTALRTVGAAVGGELGRRLTAVHDHVAVGVPSYEAWAAAEANGGEALALAGEAFAAAEADGSRLADRLEEQARDARAAAAATALAEAQALGVRAVLPLGLCFLPAFVALGVVPVVAAALGRLH